MNRLKFILLTAGIALATAFTFSCSSDDSGGNQNNNGSLERLYCDYGPVTQWGGGCFEIDNASDCDTEWGEVVSVCGADSSPSSSSRGTSSSSAVPSTSSSAVPSSSSVGGSPTITTFVDSRDGKTYKKVKIGTQTWMAENLNYDIPDINSDKCYTNNSNNCTIYGRLYNWSKAMNGAKTSTADPSGVQGICPDGWHLPSDAEWHKLMRFLNPSCSVPGVCNNVGERLKAADGWYGDNGTNQYGFAALPGGFGTSNGNFYELGYYGYWWTSTETASGTNGTAWFRLMGYNHNRVDIYDYFENPGLLNKSGLLSVRCLQD